MREWGKGAIYFFSHVSECSVMIRVIERNSVFALYRHFYALRSNLLVIACIFRMAISAATKRK